ncbi:MAG: hydrogenase nickel incorporation protein HypB [Actinomycetota bacterium]
MCATCGCSSDEVTVTSLAAPPHDHVHEDGHPHDHAHDDDHVHDHGHGEAHGHAAPTTQTLVLEEPILAKNDALAEANRQWFSERRILAVNLMSSPGSGKTTLLERTIRDLSAEVELSVVEGDQETLLDADRIKSAGAKVVQINTGSGCHLDAGMVARGLSALDPAEGSVVLIENVGNLVCPALFDLGERAKIVIMSVTEGHDKPLKYPQMFRAATLMVVNKIDLLPYVNFDVDQCVSYARQINPKLEVVTVSATRGDGLDSWYGWLTSQR